MKRDTQTVNPFLVQSNKFSMVRSMQKQQFINKVRRIHNLFDKKELDRIDYIICAIHSQRYRFPFGIGLSSLITMLFENSMLKEHFNCCNTVELIERMIQKGILYRIMDQINITQFGMCYLLGVY